MPSFNPGLFPRRRWSLRVLACAVLLLGWGSTAVAATARVRWLPVSNAIKYNVYVRSSGTAYGSAIPVFNPQSGTDGSISATITFTPAGTGTNYFAVTAVAATAEESGISGELPIGATNPCKIDRCSARTSCQFGTYVDGTACDDPIFCNGHESCLNGTCVAGAATDCSDGVACTTDACDESSRRCTHSGPPGCCFACESEDPCLARACEMGECLAEPGNELEVSRLKLINKAAGIKLAGRGVFVPDTPVDLTVTGATVEFLNPLGDVLYSSVIAGRSFKEGVGGRYRFAATRVQSEQLSNGITRLDIRIKHDGWYVTLKAETHKLDETFLEPGITWLLRFGDSCARRRDMECTAGEKLNICR